MNHDFFNFDEYKLKILDKTDYEIIKNLYEKCSDYFILSSNTKASNEDIDELLFKLPPNKTLEDKFIFGMFLKDNLIGVIDLIKNFPEKYEWIIGLFLIDPSKRKQGFGKMFHNKLLEFAKSNNAKSIRIGVIEENIDGIKFWENIGYKKTDEISMKIKNKNHIVDIMKLKL
ncbi:GNAT family N-acetyltransferase [Oceanotoga sp. DSM 15011]|uniref:GNAT family N-acetyltransferase n=1 Tax=Oceanotoga sp. DSM 15011 TaxID=2984951 RepID=UPI0021F47698|nr:GNAT family N-acetyltransferase [Oceanotoga sp. DSM 15011]UYO98829.1 GNAT family N-acetyltransferase [Oceanotoga sp. DSM 15011]